MKHTNNLTLAPAARRTPTYVEYYESWFNDFLSVGRFAEYYGLEYRKAHKVINKGRVLRQDKFGHH